MYQSYAPVIVLGVPEAYQKCAQGLGGLGLGAGLGVPGLCTRIVQLVCTLACFASGGGQKVGRSGGRMEDIEGTFKFTKSHAHIYNVFADIEGLSSLQKAMHTNMLLLAKCGTFSQRQKHTHIETCLFC